MKHLNNLRKVCLPLLVVLLSYAQSFAAPMSGTYTIPGSFTNLYQAVNALSTNGVSGACVFNIAAGAYTATTNDWQVAIPNIAGASATNTITFQAAGGPGTVTITATGTSTANYVERFNSCGFITFKDLTFVNNNTTYGHVIEFTGSANNNTVTNCILNSTTSTSTTIQNSTNAVVYAYQMTAGNTTNTVKGCQINNGNIGVHIVNTSTSVLIDNFIIDNNVFSANYTAGISSQYTSAMKVRGNQMSKTGAGTYYGMYTYYNYAGLEIRTNTITANSGVSGSVYGMNLNYLYSNSNVANQVLTTKGAITGNIININTTNTGTGTGSAYGIYHQYGTFDSVSDNTITTTTYTGTQYPLYNYGSSTMYLASSPNSYPGAFNTISGNTIVANATSSGQLNCYLGMYQEKPVIVNNNVSCKTVSGSINQYNAYYCDSLTFNNNTIYDSSGTSSITTYTGMYGNPSVTYSYWGSIQNNNIRAISQASSQASYVSYYLQNHVVSNNTFYFWAATSQSVAYFSMYNIGGTVTNNNYTMYAGTSVGACYLAYYCQNATYSGNTLNITANTSSISTIYNGYLMAGTTYTNNTVNMRATSYTTSYWFYGANGSTVTNNNFNIVATSSLSATFYDGYASDAPFNYSYNNVNFTYPSGSLSHYLPYSYYNSAGGTVVLDHNKFNFNAGSSGSVTNYLYDLNSHTTQFSNNIINATSGSGTVYGLYYYYPNCNFFGNAITTSTTGANYTVYSPYTAYANSNFYSNTFNNQSTSTGTNYTWYTGSVYTTGPTATFRNNIFYRASATASSTNAAPFQWVDNSASGDYNLYYSAVSGSPLAIINGTSYTTIPALRATGRDKNSLTYPPGLNADGTPNPNDPNSWAIQGRGIQIPGNGVDALGNPRALTTSAGVPDLGAYEFTPNVPAPFCVATPATAVAGSDQVFTFGQDTVAVISWAATSSVPAAGQIFCKQYTGVQPPSGFTAFNPTYMNFYDSIDVNVAGTYNYSIKNYFKDPWLGTIATKSVLHLAKKDVANAGAWTGYAYAISTANIVRNFINTVPTPTGFSNFGLFTGMDIAHNAGVSPIAAAPTGTFCPSTQLVKINVLNNGNNVINSLKLDWTLNTVPQPQISITTPININNGTPGSNMLAVPLGNINFGSSAVIIKAWTSLPNGQPDPVAADDTATIYLHAALNGVYFVDASNGPSTDYLSVTAAVSDLYTYGVCGPVTFRIRTGSYNGRIDLNGNAAGMSAVNRVTFMSDNGIASSANITFTSTAASDFTLRMYNATDFTFKNLTITAASTTYGYTVYQLGTCKRDSIVGCILTAGGNTSSYQSPIYAYGLVGPTGLVYQNNTLNGGYYGFYYYPGSSATTASADVTFEGNTINSPYYYNCFVYYTGNMKINNNVINGSSTSYYGIYVYNYYVYGTQFTPYSVSGNKIRGMQSSGYPLMLQYPNGYGLAGTPATRSKVCNNDVGTSGSYYGFMYLYYPINTDVWNNSFNIPTVGYYGGYVYAYSSPYVGVDFRNNAVNLGTGGTYGPYLYVINGNGNQFDYNNWVYTGSAAWQTYFGSYANFAAYKSAMASYNFEKNSFSYPMGYIANTATPDPANPNSWSMNGRGVHIAGNSTDINGNPRVTLRANGTPDIGAYEFEPTVAPPNCTAVPATATPGAWQHYLFGTDTVASIYWRPDLLYTSPLNVKQYSGRIATAASPITSISPNRFMYFYTDITATNPGTTYHFDANVYYKDIWLGRIQNEPGLMMAEKTALYPWQIYANGSSGVTVARKMLSVADVTSFGAFTGIDTVATFSAFIHPGGSTIMCTGDSVTLFANTGNSYTYRWFKDGNVITGATASSYVVKAGGDYYVEVTAPGPPTYVANSIPISISVVPPPMALISANGALTYCTGTSLTLTTSPGASVYQWQLNGVNVGGNTNTYTVGAAGKYKVIVRNIGCSVTSPETIVNPGPLLVNLGPDIEACEKKNIPYVIDAGHPGAKYSWYLNGNNTGDTTQKINVFKGAGDYMVIVDAGPGCLAKDTVHMQINPLPTVTGISFIKSGNQYQFSASGAQNATSYLWIFDDNGTITTSTQQTPPAKNFAASMITKLVVCNNCGCDTTTVVDWATGIPNTPTEGYEVSLYPNPAKDKVTLNAKGDITFTDITVLNSIGEVVYKEAAVNAKTKDIDVSMFANGHYMIRANTTQGSITKPFNIVR